MFGAGVHNTNPQIQRDFYKSQWSSISKFEMFQQLIVSLVETGESKTFYKFSDGEYLWLTGQQLGSTAPGKRDTNQNTRNLIPFQEGVIQNDYLMCQLLNEHVSWFRSYFKKDFDFPVDYVYFMVASKWFTKTFNGKIGLIGAGPKLDLIKELCAHEQYKNYLEFDGFTDYIHAPQRYLCDNLDDGERVIGEQLSNSTSSIFLVGIGHAQQALLHKMKKYKDAVYIVVGSGIDAYAGIQDNLRPYMGAWINYHLSNYDYSKIDIWKERFLNKIML